MKQYTAEALKDVRKDIFPPLCVAKRTDSGAWFCARIQVAPLLDLNADPFVQSAYPALELREQLQGWQEPWLIGSLRPLSQAPQEERKLRSNVLSSKNHSPRAVVWANKESGTLDEVCRSPLQGRKNKQPQVAYSDCVQRATFFPTPFSNQSVWLRAERLTLTGRERLPHS